jgi:hypothetical protein
MYAVHFSSCAISRSKLFLVYFCFWSSANGIFLLDDFSLGLYSCVAVLVFGNCSLFCTHIVHRETFGSLVFLGRSGCTVFGLHNSSLLS